MRNKKNVNEKAIAHINLIVEISKLTKKAAQKRTPKRIKDNTFLSFRQDKKLLKICGFARIQPIG